MTEARRAGGRGRARDAIAFHDRYHGTIGTLERGRVGRPRPPRSSASSRLSTAPSPSPISVSPTDMADPARGALLSKLRSGAAAIETALLFFGLEWAEADTGVVRPGESCIADRAKSSCGFVDPSDPVGWSSRHRHPAGAEPLPST